MYGFETRDEASEFIAMKSQTTELARNLLRLACTVFH